MNAIEEVYTLSRDDELVDRIIFVDQEQKTRTTDAAA